MKSRLLMPAMLLALDRRLPEEPTSLQDKLTPSVTAGHYQRRDS